MKKITALFIALILTLNLCACTAGQPEIPGAEESQGPTWQEQYNLGVRYLSEGNYQEAIIAFTAAIEIDPKRAPAYVGRGDAYVLSGETEENLTAAKVDYEKAIELDETSAEAYLGLADVYIRQGDYEKAMEILRQALEKLGDCQEIADRINDLKKTIFAPDHFFTALNFKEFDELEPELQQWVKSLIGNIDKGDLVIAEMLVGEPNGTFEIRPGLIENQICTFYDEFKISLGQQDDSSGVHVQRNVEIRQKDGFSYYCRVTRMNLSTVVVWTSRGETQNWNWNGKFKQIRRYYPDSDNESTETVEGNCVNNLIDGRTVYSHSDNHGSIFSYYRDYNMGIASEQAQDTNGETILLPTPDEPYIYELCTDGWISDPNGQDHKW